MTSDSYPNLMCFGNDIVNCPLLDECPDYRACNKRYEEKWLQLSENAERSESA